MKRICFFDKVFLRKPDGPLRGVEVFNRRLVEDLARMQIEVTLPITAGWRGELGDLASLGVEIVTLPTFPGSHFNALQACPRLRGRFDTLLLGNVGTGVMPAVQWLKMRTRFDRLVVIAHREAPPRFVRLCANTPGAVVAVNRQIARPFERGGCDRVEVSYGVTRPEPFLDIDRSSPQPDRIRFGVLGALDNPWKGADTAMEAFAAAKTQLAGGAELHLCAYEHPPQPPDPDIVAYEWMPVERIPDFLASLDVLLVPSRDEEVMRETFSQAMVQGMLSGLPVVAHDLPVLREKLDEGGGMLYASADECAEAMVRLAQDPLLRKKLGEEAREVARRRYVWDSRLFAERFL